MDHVYLGGSLVATREVSTVIPGGQVKYQHTDALGSPIAVTDASKVIVQTNEYEPYGKLVNRLETNGVGYTGHVQDTATGLTYMQQRYYDPMIGRFLSVDPITANSGTGANFNRYWYGNNNPYKFTDPDGRLGHRNDVPYWDVPGMIGNWFAKATDLSVDAAYGSYAAGRDALPEHYQKAGTFILTVHSIALPELGAGVTLQANAARFAAGATREAIAARVLTEAGELRLSKTAANSIANRPYVTPLSVQETIIGGTRVADPQGAAGRYMYTADVTYGKSAGRFEVLVNELKDVVEHAVYKSEGGR